MAEPLTPEGKALLSQLVSDGWDEALTAPVIRAIEDAARAADIGARTVAAIDDLVTSARLSGGDSDVALHREDGA